MKERRELKRFILEVPARVEVTTSANERQVLDLVTSNVCAGGAFFPTAEALAEGIDLQLDLAVPLDRLKDLTECRGVNVQVNGTVVRSESTGMAVRFGSQYRMVPL